MTANTPSPDHPFAELFAQLGLPCSPAEINAFIHEHRPIAGDMLLVDAPFWTAAQVQFIQEKKASDSPEWISVIEQLNSALREPKASGQAPVPRLLGISGSLRKASYNTALLREAQAALQGKAVLELVTLHGIPLYDGDLEDAHGLPDAVITLRRQIQAADGIVLSTPEYNSGVPGVLKNALDWLSRVSEPHPNVLSGKPIALMGATIGNFGTALAQNHWLPVLHALGFKLWSGGGKLTVPRAQQTLKDGVADEALQSQLQRFVQGFAESVARNKLRQSHPNK